MNTGLSKANQTRKEKALRKLYNFSEYGVTSFKRLIEKGVFVKSEEAQVPKIKYNRVKYNRMDWEEQRVYDLKMKETKPEYRLYYDDEIFTVVSKFVFEYYNEVNERQSA